MDSGIASPTVHSRSNKGYLGYRGVGGKVGVRVGVGVGDLGEGWVGDGWGMGGVL